LFQKAVAVAQCKIVEESYIQRVQKEKSDVEEDKSVINQEDF
jgi:hypothetical protein